jgi:hypothetical protein
MRLLRLLLIGAAVLTEGCAAFAPGARTQPAPSGAPLSAPDPFPAAQPLPFLPEPVTQAWPRVYLGQAVTSPPQSSIARTPAAQPAATIATASVSSLPWKSEFESTQRRAIQTAQQGSGDEHVLITGSLSGNDPASVRMLDALLERFVARPELLDGREAILVRDPHPDGLAEHIMVNARGVDLNRNFPSPRFTASPSRETGPHAASEAETRVLLRLLGDSKPTRVIHVRTGKSERTLVTGNAACLELLERLRNEYAVDVATFDGEFKAGSLEEFAATRLKAQVLMIDLPAQRGPPATVDLLVAASVGMRPNPQSPDTKPEAAPVAEQPSTTSPAALTGAVEPSGPDGQKGYVELLPPPPEFAGDGRPVTESRFYELSPP